MKFYPALRLAWAERHVCRVGTLCRLDLQNAFGVSNGQASLDIAELLRLRPDFIRYDASLKFYVQTRADSVPTLPAPECLALIGQFPLRP